MFKNRLQKLFKNISDEITLSKTIIKTFQLKNFRKSRVFNKTFKISAKLWQNVSLSGIIFRISLLAISVKIKVSV